jgi:outer membrane receptor protein involved in Fe transport
VVNTSYKSCFAGQASPAKRVQNAVARPRLGRKIGWLVTSALAALTATPHAAWAAAPPAAGSSVPTSVSEVVVTAEKRESTVQKTPLSITAVAGEDLQARGLTSAQDIVRAVPGIAVSSAGPGQAQYEIRGLSADGGESPTVGFYLDETPITPPALASSGKSEVDPDLYDLARAEVLRGPQGTLYGAGSLGGTVKLVTNPPDFSGFYGSAQTALSGTDGGGLNYLAKGMVNIPLVEDKAALRVVGDYSHDSGWISRIVEPDFPQPNADGSRGDVLSSPTQIVHRGENDEDLVGVRAALLLKPTDRLTLTPTIFVQRTRQGGMNASDAPPGGMAHYQPFDVAEPYSDRFIVYALTANYAFDDVSVTSATSYWKRHTTQLQDCSEQVAGLFGLATSDFGPCQAYELDYTRQFSQELRLASTGSGRFQWIVGAFYSDFFAGFQMSTDTPDLATDAGGAFGTSNLFSTHGDNTIKQKAVFVHASYDLGRGFKIEGGARYYAYRSAFFGAATGFVFGPDGIIHQGAASASGVSPMVNLSWSRDRNLLLYASAAKGFREGAANIIVPTDNSPLGLMCSDSLKQVGLTSAPASFNPDTVWSYEAGEKARLFDGRVTFDSDAFYIVWSKIQQPVGLSCGESFIANGPTATVKGAEAEIQAQLTPNLSLSQSVGYAYAAFNQDYAPAAVVKGQVLYDAPRWTLSTNLRYRRPLGPFDLVAQAQNSFQSSSLDVTYQVNRLPSRDLTNVRVGVATKAWSAYAFVNNIFNVHAVMDEQGMITVMGPNFNREVISQPLTAGVELDANF